MAVSDTGPVQRSEGAGTTGRACARKRGLPTGDPRGDLTDQAPTPDSPARKVHRDTGGGIGLGHTVTSQDPIPISQKNGIGNRAATPLQDVAAGMSALRAANRDFGSLVQSFGPWLAVHHPLLLHKDPSSKSSPPPRSGHLLLSQWDSSPPPPHRVPGDPLGAGQAPNLIKLQGPPSTPGAVFQTCRWSPVRPIGTSFP